MVTGGGEGRVERGCRRARLHAGFAQRRAKTRPRWKSWSARRSAAASSSSMWPTKTWWWTAARCSKRKSAPTRNKRYSEVKEGETVHGTVRSLTDYGAFVDIGGVDALLHVADISWGRVNKPADVLTVGQQVEARVLKVDPAKKRDFARHEAASAASVGPGRREVQGRRARARHGDARHRFRRVRGAGEGHRRADPSLRDVLVARRCASPPMW